ncbi:MAG TPA: TIM barrel protein [Phycisphaerae bacterium]|nr:TIM barrel protein [Phycisphaerae bacterium]
MPRELKRLVASPCSAPKWTLDEVMATHAELGFRKYEAFTGWVASALDVKADPAGYVEAAERHGMRYTSFHLPAVGGEDFDASVAGAIEAARFARAIGAGIVLYKAKARPDYVRAAPAMLDACEALGLTAVVQNHKGSALNDAHDVCEVLEGVTDDRLKALLEVGHFHQAGVPWDEAYAFLRGRIALVHVKDIAEGEPVGFGEGELDFAALAATLDADGYAGDWVVELEGKCWEDPKRYLCEAVERLAPLVEG